MPAIADPGASWMTPNCCARRPFSGLVLPALPEQNFADFSRVCAHHLPNEVFTERGYPEFAPMTGQGATEYVSLIGLRADEPRRVARVMSRNHLGSDDPERMKRAMTDGEIVCTPLADAGVANDDVLSFWEDRDWRLALPPDANLSNCVFCFMERHMCDFQRPARRCSG